MDQEQSSSLPPSETPADHRGSHSSFFQKRSNIIAVLAVLITIAAIPLTIKFSQQRQTTQQHAGTDLSCTRNHWTAIPGWLGGGNTLGNGYYCGPENPENHARCAATGAYNDNADGSGKWLPGPALPAGTIAGVGGNYPNFSTVFGGKLPVDYDSAKDILRYEFSGHAGVESSWARVMRWTDDYMRTYPELSPEVTLKYMIMRLKRDALSTSADTSKIGFDVSSIDTAQYPGDGQALIDRMRTESQTCTPPTNVSPTSTQPVSCNVHLMEPPQDYQVNIAVSNPHSCPEATAIDNNTGKATAQELIDCGPYWLTKWCDAKGNAAVQQDIVYACRGWSVVTPGNPITYYPHRVGELTKTIPTTDDGKRQLWNTVMGEVYRGHTSYGNNFGGNGGLGGPKDDADVLSRVIFGHDFWNTQKSIESQNNCSTTWNNPETGPTDGPTINFSVDKAQVQYAQTATLTWSATDAVSCDATSTGSDGKVIPAWNGTKPLTGTWTEGPYGGLGTYTYILSCTRHYDNPSKDVVGRKTVTVTVSSAGTNPTISAEPSLTVVPTGPTATINPNGTILNLTVLLHGIGTAGDSDSAKTDGSTKDPKTPNRPATLYISDAQNTESSQKVKQITLVFDKTTGKYTSQVDISDLNLPSGSYNVKIKTDSFLTKQFCIGSTTNNPGFGATNTACTGTIAITAGAQTTLPQQQEITGDTDNNNELRVDDYNAIRSCVTSTVENKTPAGCTDALKKAADLNDDGLVNVTDYTLFIRELAHRFGD